MAIHKLDTTKIPEIFVQNLEKFSESLLLDANYTGRIFDVVITGISYFLSDAKNKQNPVAVIFEKNNGDMIVAAIVQYHAGKTDKDPGSWSYVWTFNASDIPENTKVWRFTDSNVKIYFYQTSMSKYSFEMDAKYQAFMIQTLFETLIKYLDDNALEGEVTTIECDGLFQAKSVIENGEVVKSMEVIGDTKLLIKDDAAIEK